VTVKTRVKSGLPSLVRLIHRIRGWPLRRRTPQEIFRRVHERNRWGDVDSRSGSGSNLQETETIRTELPMLLREFHVRSILDAPCGDFYWMKGVDLGEVSYIGADIVQELVANNNAAFANESRQFAVLDILIDDVPIVDFILCRDCLVHFSFEHAWTAIGNFKASGSRFLGTTTYTRQDDNEDIVTGQWRPLNLQLAPFNFGEPLRLINEKSSVFDGAFSDKCLGIWKIGDLP
jgi:hypothetical protein